VTTPPVKDFSYDGTHRLIPSRYSVNQTVLADVVEDGDEAIQEMILLDGVTNERILGESGGLSGITPYELVYGIPNAHIVNAAFTHTRESGSRFSDGNRGAWYAADDIDTSLAEVVYHKAKNLGEIIVPDLPQKRPDFEVSTYDDWLADFKAKFHFLEPQEQYAEYLQPEPVPFCYGESQALARMLIQQKSCGLVYPSVRRPGYECVVCFRPALVYNPTQGERLELTLTASEAGYSSTVRAISGEAYS
jgi:RES domain-containing protein